MLTIKDRCLQKFFFITQTLVKLSIRKYCKIDKVEKDKVSGEYLITFFYLGKRQLYLKSAIEIFKNNKLICEFNPLDAAMIGLYAAQSHYEKCNQKIKL